MSDINIEAEIAVLKEKIEGLQKDIKKMEERNDKRMSQMEGLHKKVLYSMAFGLVVVLAKFGEDVLSKLGFGK